MSITLTGTPSPFMAVAMAHILRTSTSNLLPSNTGNDISGALILMGMPEDTSSPTTEMSPSPAVSMSSGKDESSLSTSMSANSVASFISDTTPEQPKKSKKPKKHNKITKPTYDKSARQRERRQEQRDHARDHPDEPYIGKKPSMPKYTEEEKFWIMVWLVEYAAENDGRRIQPAILKECFDQHLSSTQRTADGLGTIIGREPFLQALRASYRR